jgi:hypothetical protein
MDLLSWDMGTVLWRIIWAVSVLFGAYKAIQALTGWVFTSSRKRNLALLQKRRARLIQLHESDREYYGWLLSGILAVLILLALLLAIEGITAPPIEHELLVTLIRNFIRFVVGLWAFTIAAPRYLDYHELQHFDRILARLDRKIAKLEGHPSSPPAPAGT